MKMCTKILMSAVMSVSIGAAAFAQSSSGASAGSSASGNQNQTGGSAPAAGGTGLTTPSDRSNQADATNSTGAGASGSSAAGSTAAGTTGSDALGSQTADTSRTMHAGGDADAMIGQQLDKIASMPDKAGDALFVLDAAKDNLFEVAFAKLAQQKSQDDKIKDLAQMIEKDHTEANEQLKPIAEKMGLQLPSSLPGDKQKMLNVFQAMDAKDFDTCYLLDNKAGHAKDITSFTDHQKSVKDEDLRKYISAVLPKLQQHGMHVTMLASEKGFAAPMGGRGHGMDHGMDHGSDNNAK